MAVGGGDGGRESVSVDKQQPFGERTCGIAGDEERDWEAGGEGAGGVQLLFLLLERSSSSEPISTCSHRSVCVCRLAYQTHPAVRGGVEEGGVACDNGPSGWCLGRGWAGLQNRPNKL